MNEHAEQLRSAARAALPPDALLRLDRGEALYVTDAPRRDREIWPRCAEALAASGFDIREANGLARLAPGARWLTALGAARPDPPDFLSASLYRFAGQAATPQALSLAARALRRLSGDKNARGLSRELRRQAAVALRTSRGGGLYACALLINAIEEEETP